MIRERRSKEKLQQYYRRFVAEGNLDANVHPWVAESWQRSRDAGIARDSLRPQVKLSKPELEERRKEHHAALAFLDGLYQELRGNFNNYSLSLLLLDSECYALKSFALPFFQKSPGEVEGARLTEADIGTSSIAIAFQHKTPFLVFGPEMWIEDGQAGDACSAPIFLGGKLQYILTLVSTQQGDLPVGAIESLLLLMRYSMEHSLALEARLDVKHVILDAIPLAAYHVLPGGRVAYANKQGQARLMLTGQPGKQTEQPELRDSLLNYQHSPLVKGFLGIPSHNKELTWITPQKTYEDITTVLPIYRDGEVSSIIAVSQSIEDLQMLEAHAIGYTARYGLASMVGNSPGFLAMKEKAARLARTDQFLLLQGEAGTGKQRLAHGIHKASARAAGPLITIKCGAIPPELLADEVFGTIDEQGSRLPGKLELANGGTLFLDEVEMLPMALAEQLADVLVAKRLTGRPAVTIDVRLIAACDSDLRRLTEKGKFAAALYELVDKPLIRVPALRTRRDDIAVLAAHILQELAEQHDIPAKKITPEAITLLESYDWPGNIKQLQTVVEQAFFAATEELIDSTGFSLPGEAGPDSSWKDDRQAFGAVWQAARGNVSRLSGMLGVSRVTLYRYLKKFGLEKQ
ncbi:MAG: sigma 54-interacting transcriptional regulator [Negativicutes bacterium]|nr:sigma 54-interacting transcriptional regulator [Negativicutes bacterium]